MIGLARMVVFASGLLATLLMFDSHEQAGVCAAFACFALRLLLYVRKGEVLF